MYGGKAGIGAAAPPGISSVSKKRLRQICSLIEILVQKYKMIRKNLFRFSFCVVIASPIAWTYTLLKI